MNTRGGKSRSKTTEFIIGNESGSADFEACGSEVYSFFIIMMFSLRCAMDFEVDGVRVGSSEAGH